MSNSVDTQIVNDLSEKMALLKAMASHNCPKCYGRGYDGINYNRFALICKCVLKNYAKADEAKKKEYSALATLNLV